MAEIVVKPTSQFIKVLAAQSRGERLDSKVVAEANQIVTDLITDLSPQNRHMFAQTIGFAVNELQQNSLDFLNQLAEQKNIEYGAKAAFDIQTRGVMAQIQAKGSTPVRSYVTDRRISVDTFEIAARPAIQINDLLTGRVQMSRLISEANEAITLEKVRYVESVLHAAISNFQTPFYGTGTGVVGPTLDSMLDYFSDFGPVTILGSASALRQVSQLAGAMLDPTTNHFSDNMIDTVNANGHLGVYNTADLVKLTNAYYPGTTKRILDPNWLYIVPGGYTGDARNLKIVNEGAVRAYERQDPDDESLEVTLKLWFGASFVTMDRLPNIGAYLIG